jgi:hypothetical protein
MSIDDIRHFLVIYDVNVGEAEVKEFDEYQTAVAAYDEIEEKTRGRRDLDIVLFGADSLETVKKTHSSYFETTQHGFERFFKDALAAAARR